MISLRIYVNIPHHWFKMATMNWAKTKRKTQTKRKREARKASCEWKRKRRRQSAYNSSARITFDPSIGRGVQQRRRTSEWQRKWTKRAEFIRLVGGNAGARITLIKCSIGIASQIRKVIEMAAATMKLYAAIALIICCLLMTFEGRHLPSSVFPLSPIDWMNLCDNLIRECEWMIGIVSKPLNFLFVPIAWAWRIPVTGWYVVMNDFSFSHCVQRNYGKWRARARERALA